ncbi:hypothetical protein CB0940_08164 [Cercospora beticola]|nr:hypothetical protein CB0940_08164 [Cercospora beticola]PIA94593.1 hypothetical protein CB0940_08164 [Cercospora beticola]
MRGMERSFDDPAVALLHEQATACKISLDSIVDKIPENQSGDSFHGTTKHVWDEERTRFILWRKDLLDVIEEIHNLDPAQAIRIASSNLSASLRDLASDLIEVLAVVDGSRLPLEQQQENCEQLAAEEDDDGLDSRELVERLDAVSSTINGLTRTLKLQYSYALKHAEQGTAAPSEMLQTEDTAYAPGDARTAPGRKWSGQLVPSISTPPADAPIDGMKWTLPRLGLQGFAPAVTQRQSSARQPVSITDVHSHSRQDILPRGLVPDQETQFHAESQPSAAMKVVQHTGDFKLRPSRFFKVGRVLTVLWTEPAGESGPSSTTQSFTDAYNERVYAKVRRFIVVAKREQHVLAVPVFSYQGMGPLAAKPRSLDHGIVYMGSEAPRPLKNEVILPTPVRVIPDNPEDRLASTSRINYGKIYTIEHNIKCRGVGMVHAASIAALLSQQNEVMRRGYPSIGLGGISEEEQGANSARSGIDPHIIDEGTEEGIDSQAHRFEAPVPALRSVDAETRVDRGSDSGYGNSRAATEARSVGSSVADDNGTRVIKEVDDLGPGHILSFIDEQKLEVPRLDPDNPTAEQLEALSDSSIQILLESLLSEQQRRL